MNTVDSDLRDARLRAENIGGIDETEVTFEPGVTILVGRNATNRTSLLQAIMAAFGSEHASLKGDADEGEVELAIGDETATRQIHRQPDGLRTDGDPYLDDPELADLFAFLLETNEARRTVALGGDLRELIMEPVDTDAIQDDVEQVQAEIRDLEAELEEIESEAENLAALEERKQELEAEIEETQEALAAKNEEIEAADADVDETKEEKAELEEKLDELQGTRSSLESVRFRIENEQQSLETLEAELEELSEARDELSAVDPDETDRIGDELDRLRNRKQALDSEINDLQSVIQFNEEMLEGTSVDVVDALRDGDAPGDVTDQLLDTSESVVCWTCGTEVDPEQIEETLERLRDLRTEKFEARNGITSDIDDLEAERETLQERVRRREEVEEKLDRAKSDIEDREARIEDLEGEREDLKDEIERLEAEIEDLENQDYSELLELHEEANQLEFTLEQRRNDHEDVTGQIEAIESRVEEKSQIEAQLEEHRELLTDLRTRIEQIERQAIEEFNEHMETVLDLLDYENLDRIWIERTKEEVREGRRKVETSVFDLHVVRSTDDGTTYEDSFTHLSESEREVTGLVFALAGYLTHEVYETVPFVLMDSLEALDSERIARIVEYLEEYADYLVVALLPEDAAALDDAYRRISEI